uniref:Uncharacterized protein n=1 Tax=Ralstonia syzygii R24 TaxID=907261 RepID=G2ZYR3_9RALS|nr:hypothetical protein RALSY_10783 [Ralstonia syzygii R24]
MIELVSRRLAVTQRTPVDQRSPGFFVGRPAARGRAGVDKDLRLPQAAKLDWTCLFYERPVLGTPEPAALLCAVPPRGGPC